MAPNSQPDLSHGGDDRWDDGGGSFRGHPAEGRRGVRPPSSHDGARFASSRCRRGDEAWDDARDCSGAGCVERGRDAGGARARLNCAMGRRRHVDHDNGGGGGDSDDGESRQRSDGSMGVDVDGREDQFSIASREDDPRRMSYDSYCGEYHGACESEGHFTVDSVRYDDVHGGDEYYGRDGARCWEEEGRSRFHREADRRATGGKRGGEGADRGECHDQCRGGCSGDAFGCDEERPRFDRRDTSHPAAGHRTEWALDRVEFHQMPRPQSMPFDESEELYGGDDEHQYEQEAVVPEEVAIMQDERESEECYQQRGQSCDHRDDDSTMNEGQRHTATAATGEPIYHSSDSLEVIHRIESVMEGIFRMLDKKEEPILRGYVSPATSYRDDDDSASPDDAVDALARLATSRGGDPKFHRSFGNLAQCRSFASLCLVLSFVHQLLLSNRTTTTREVYYVFVTHFRSQRECDGVILDAAKVLGVSRRSLGLSASPKGWFCGCVEITRRGTLPSGKDVSGVIDGTALSSIQGLPITREWTERDEAGCTEDGVEIRVASKDARAILVVEKEGVYNRLSEERIFDRFPCILVTGKGFPDLATRALVSALHRELELPVVGLCDCNPYGISVLALYHCAGDRMGVDGRRRYSVPMQWLGLRPSEVARLKEDLPESVFQKLTDLDKKRIASLLDAEDPFLSEEDEEEVRGMEDAGYKCELEALYWLGPDYMGNWVVEMLKEGGIEQ